MDQIVSSEEDLDLDIESGRFNETEEEITTNLVPSENAWNRHLSFDGSENVTDDLINPLMGEEKRRERSSQSMDLSDIKFDNAKCKKTRKSSKPPRHPKGPPLSENDQKLMMEIAELTMRKRARVERMKRLKAAKSSSPWSTVFAMIVTVIFFVYLIFQGFFTTLSSESSPAPRVSANSRMVSVQLYNEFAPRERIDPTPTTSFRYRRVSGANNEEKT